MKKILILSLSAIIAFASCEEFQPVFTGEYNKPQPQEPVVMTPNITIADITSYYTKGKPYTFVENLIIGGQISTTDQPGNFYKSFYIQDATGGMEIKIGRNALYNDFRPGQTIYIDCKDLTIGQYGQKDGYGNGMIQIGFADPTGEYETSYMEVPVLIDAHVFKGQRSEGDLLPEPVVLSQSQLPGSSDTQKTNKNIGRLVTIKDLSYTWVDGYGETQTAFTLLYLNSQKNKKESSNRIFISGDDTHITTWAMSKSLMSETLESGVWDNVKLGNANDQNYGKVGDLQYKGEDGSYPGIERAAASVSHYFKTAAGTCVQIRTSGFSKFCDTEIPADVLNGSKHINVTGILCLYQGKIQMVVNNIDDITYADGTPLN